MWGLFELLIPSIFPTFMSLAWAYHPRLIQIAEVGGAAVLDADFFVCNSEELFLQSARLMTFEAYCRIHQRIDLRMLADKLGMELIAAEKWIVKMVSDAQLNAKIDSQSGHVILGAHPPDVYQQVIEKTKGLSFRSYVLAQNLEKRSSAAAAMAAGAD